MTTTILIADDEEFIVEMVRILLEDEGYRVLCARDGLEALALAEQEHPALILSDVMMPHLTGIELARQLRVCQDGDSPPIILLSAVVPPRSLPERTVFLRKPFDIEALSRLVADLLAAP